MVRFSAKPKNEPHSPPSRERSERENHRLGFIHDFKIALNILFNPSFVVLKRGFAA
ncbi:MAG: hypothetical protein U5L45_24760 [Saprospiraceae bacterium]|nr:hypothetical protein [Saprospiraceae bacterium]